MKIHKSSQLSYPTHSPTNPACELAHLIHSEDQFFRGSFMRYAICNETFHDRDIAAVLLWPPSAATPGWRFAPFTLAPYVHDITATQRAEIRNAAKASGCKSSACIGCWPRPRAFISPHLTPLCVKRPASTSANWRGSAANSMARSWCSARRCAESAARRLTRTSTRVRCRHAELRPTRSRSDRGDDPRSNRWAPARAIFSSRPPRACSCSSASPRPGSGCISMSKR